MFSKKTLISVFALLFSMLLFFIDFHNMALSSFYTWLSVSETCGLPINMYHWQNKRNTHSEKSDLRDTENLALVTLPLGREHIFNDPFERFTIEMCAVFQRIGQSGQLPTDIRRASESARPKIEHRQTHE
jgi:hypothetical protein